MTKSRPLFAMIRREQSRWIASFVMLAWGGSGASLVRAQDVVLKPMYIREYRVQGAKQLSAREVQETVYPYLGPGRLPADVDQARAALEKAYHVKGYQAVSVQIPQQQMKRGIVVLRVEENPVGRLRVRGSKYTSPSAITDQAPSIQEGKVVNFKDVSRDIVRLNQYPGREVTPSLRAGVEPGTVDIDLQVKDELPLHGSLELNNRYSPDTSHLRLNGAINYDNLWQKGHSFGLNFQIAPENMDDARVFGAYYSTKISDTTTLMLSGTKQDSDVSTLGGSAVAGRGEVIGLHAVKVLPFRGNFSHSFNFGIDYKKYDDSTVFGGHTDKTPITYYPISGLYNASWKKGEKLTEFNGGVTLHMRGLGSDLSDYDNKRYGADGSFIYFRGDLSHTRDLPQKMQGFARIQGQVSSQPLIASEQFAAGGLGTVRGYLESETLGDDAVFGTLELRSPSFFASAKEGEVTINDWRAYAFVDGGVVTLQDALPGQKSSESLLGVGVGTRGQLWEHYHGSLDAGFPLLDRPNDRDNEWLLTFRLWGDF